MSDSTEASKKYPLVSIGMPTYNGARRIVRAFGSVLKQDYPNLEIIVCDNCSTDDTQELCEKMAREYPFIRYIRHPKNLGILSNFEYALQEAKGKYYMWLSDDDFIEPGILGKYAEFLENNPDYQIVTGQVRYWRNGKVSHLERLNLDHDNARKRVIAYYHWVRWGAMFHGLMRTSVAQSIAIRRVYGSDWHYVANLVYLGKIRTLDFVGYNKSLGGSSSDHVKNAKSLNEPAWVGYVPMAKIAMDAFKEFYRSPAFDSLKGIPKFLTAASAYTLLMLRIPRSLRHNLRIMRENYSRRFRSNQPVVNQDNQI